MCSNGNIENLLPNLYKIGPGLVLTKKTINLEKLPFFVSDIHKRFIWTTFGVYDLCFNNL